MTRPCRRLPALTLVAACFASLSAHALDITTQRYDQNRTAANLQETVLRTSNITPTGFGKQGAYAVDGLVFAHPLYMQGLKIGTATTNVLFVATMHNVVYAFDADRPGSAPLWKRDFRTATSTVVASQWAGQIGGEMGIFSTPVIDAASGEMYLVAYAAEGNRNLYRLYSLNILTGADTKPPTVVEPNVQGGRQLDHPRNFQRAGLAMAGRQIWIAFGGNSLDTRPYTGWVLTYDKTTLQLSGQFRTSVYDGATIWQGGGAPSVDADGNVYLLTANGWGPGASSYDGVANFAQSLLKLGPTASTLIDHFTPIKQPVFDALDQDFSTNTPVLIPGTDLVTASSKLSDVYVARRSNLGKQKTGDSGLVQTWRVGTAVVGDGAFNEGSRVVGTVYWDRVGAPPLYYVWPGRDQLRMYSFDGQKFSANAVVTGTVTGAGEPGVAMSLSANGSTSGTGVLWASRTTVGASAMNLPSVLEAYDAENPTKLLWTSTTDNTRDGVGSAAKFVIPTVANGRVYLPTQNGTVLVYGLLPDFSLTPAATTVTASAGDMASTTLSLAGFNGYSGTATLSASGLPAGVTASFSQASIGNGGAATVRLSAAGTVPAGTYPITISATSGSTVRSTVVSLKINAAAANDFTLTPANGALNVGLTGSGSVNVTVGAVGGFNGAVALAASGMPSGVTARLTPATVTGNGTTTLTLSADATVPGGSSSSIVVTGTSGTKTHATAITFNVGTTVTPPTPPTPPAAPSTLTAAAAAPNSTGASVTLQWTDNSNNETGFAIQRSTSPTFASDVTTLTASANATLFVDSGPAPSTLYYYRVQAINGATSPWSNVATVLTSGQLLDGELNTIITPRKVMPLGDSVTNGTPTVNYGKLLWTTLRNNGCAVDMVGNSTWNDTSGDTDHAGFDGLRADTVATTYIDQWTAAGKPDVVLLHLGSYEAFAAVPAATTIASLGQIVAKVRALRPNATFLVSTLIRTTLAAAYNTNLTAVNALLPAFVAAQNRAGSPVILVDNASVIGTTDLLDGVRPNATGAAKMAAKWYSAMVSAGLCQPTAPMTKLSTGKAVTVTGSTGTSAPARLVNDVLNLGDEWVGTSTTMTPITIEVDLGAVRTLGLFSLSHYTGTSTVSVYNALDFRIAVRSTTTEAWRDVVAVAGNTSGATLHPVVPTAGRYVRLTLMRPNAFMTNTNYSTMREFEVYGW